MKRAYMVAVVLLPLVWALVFPARTTPQKSDAVIAQEQTTPPADDEPASSNPPMTVTEVQAVYVPTPTPTPTPEPTIDASNYYPVGGSIMGKVSYYSREGCIGCSPNLITASGEPLDDTKYTLAVSPDTIPMGTMVLVTNLSNNRQTLAKVNDTGGFAKYGRVADLSLALYNFLGAKTDKSMVLIEPVEQ